MSSCPSPAEYVELPESSSERPTVLQYPPISQYQEQPVFTFPPPPYYPPSKPAKVTTCWLGFGLPIYPTGLEVLWREVPVECQRIIEPEDVPISARHRGYFTVSELLTLKRLLMARLRGDDETVITPAAPSQKVSNKRGRSRSCGASSKAPRLEGPPIYEGYYPTAGVGGVIKEAMGVLEEHNQHHQPPVSSGQLHMATYDSHENFYYPPHFHYEHEHRNK